MLLVAHGRQHFTDERAWQTFECPVTRDGLPVLLASFLRRCLAGKTLVAENVLLAVPISERLLSSVAD